MKEKQTFIQADRADVLLLMRSECRRSVCDVAHMNSNTGVVECTNSWEAQIWILIDQEIFYVGTLWPHFQQFSVNVTVHTWTKMALVR